MNDNKRKELSIKEEQMLEPLKDQIRFIGDDPDRDSLIETPERIVRAWDEIFSGYDKDPSEVFKTFDSEGYDQIVLLKDAELFSMCEHHMLPFYGKAHIAYIPDGKVIGISKLARLLDIYSRRLQIQERIGRQIVNDLMKHLQPKGAACMIEATHLCMRMRGVSKQESVMWTSVLDGAFFTTAGARLELMSMINGKV